jgi:RHS repeat-associated protein
MGPQPLPSQCRIVLLFLVILFCQVTIVAQDQGQYDKGTPPQHAAGVSALGSYTSADLGNVNLSNGALNLKLSLGSVGGRGFSLPLTVNWSSKIWSARTDVDQDWDGPKTVAFADFAGLDDWVDIFERIGPGWTVGIAPTIFNRIVRIKQITSGPNVGCYTYTLPKLTVMLPDKGEMEFRDDAYDGAPLLSDCSGYNATLSRGRRWHATDGSGTIYISDADNAGAQLNGNLTGVVITPDGTRYHMAGNRCDSITDRNGNKITIQGSASGLDIIDQLGRTTKIQQNVADPAYPYSTLALLVTLPGYNGQNRYYKVKSGVMNANYRSDITPTTPVITGDYDPLSYGYGCGSCTRLFVHSYGLYQQRIDDIDVLTEIILPDNRSLHFKYNQFGEVAEVQMPTGGKVQYDYAMANSLPSGNSPVFETTGDLHTNVFIDRALTQRRTYPDGSTLEGTWNYGGGRVTATSPSGTLLLDQRHYFLPAGRFYTSPSGANDGTQNTLWSTGVEYRSEIRDAAGNVIAANEQDWTQRTPMSWLSYPTEQLTNDNRVNEERKYLDDGSMSKVQTAYQASVKYNNPVEVKEYDYDQTLKRRTVTSYADSANLINGLDYTVDSIHLLSLALTQTIYDGSSNQMAKAVSEYDVYANDLNHTPLQDYGTVTQHDSNYGAAYLTRGNVTRAGSWLNITNSFIYTYPRYDDLGNLTSVKDGNGNISTISYADDFGLGSNPGGGTGGSYGATYSLPTLITSPPPLPGASPHTAKSQYDFSTGLLTGFRDRNNVVTQTIYDDPFDRPTLIKAALGVGGVEAHSAMLYAPQDLTIQYGVNLTNNDVLTVTDQTNLDDKALRSWTKTDGFGRTIEAWSRDPLGDDKVTTIYDGLGRVKQTSNPFRPSLGETPVYKSTTFDLAGRVIAATTPDNAVVSIAYSGQRTLVTDQANKQRISKANALGQLTDVWEIVPANQQDTAWVATTFPGHGEVAAGYLSHYTYDQLNNLLSVTQQVGTSGSTQTRTYAFDSLKRLITATNPESGTVCFGTMSSGQCQANGYDANGNLKFKTDARGILTTYVYDALNRNITTSYTNDPAATPTINRYYDGAANGKGRFWHAETVGANGDPLEYKEVSSYDAAGRALQLWQNFRANSIWSPSFLTQRSYNRSGAVISQTYPSNRSVSYSYDYAGRVTSFSGNLGDGTLRTYASDFKYDPASRLQQEKYGTGTTPLYHKQHFNSRGQLYDMRLSTQSWTQNEFDGDRGALINYYSYQNFTPGFMGTDNNGNLTRSETYIPGSGYFQERYGNYDALNRVTSVSEFQNGSTATFTQGYLYDRYGNRRIDIAATSGSGINSKDFTVSTTTNRLGVPSGQTGVMTYDAAGNLINDTYSGTGSRSYDAENRLRSAVDGSGGLSSYGYNMDGQRVRRNSNSGAAWQVYGMDGELLAEYLAGAAAAVPLKEYGYRSGQLLVTASNATAVNLSLGRSPTQSSTIAPGTTDAAKAVDNNTDGALWDGHASATNYNTNAWWQVDLGSIQQITALQIWGRTDCCPEMTSNFYVFVSDSPFTSTDLNTTLNQSGVSHYLSSGFSGSPGTFPANRSGRYVRVQLASTQYLVLAEVQIWGQQSVAADIEWLVTDHLGTPRMIADATGNLSAIKRHDYLPFGEEVPGNFRTGITGYGIGDTVRQKFTQKERDAETGLDYFGARYYASLQGRFTGADPQPVTSESFVNPQRWNQYSYVNNNPLAAADPSGGDGQGKGGDKVISVFLSLSQDDARNTITTTAPGKDPVKTYAAGPWPAGGPNADVGNGYQLQMHGENDMIGLPMPSRQTVNEGDFENALSNSEVVIYAGHGGSADTGVGTNDSPVHQKGIEMGDTLYEADGKHSVMAETLLGPQKGYPKPDVSAKVVVNFSCDASSQGGSYFNFTGKGQLMVTINSGRNGVTDAATVEKAAAAFVKTYAATPGNYEAKAAAAAEAAKAIVNSSKKPDDVKDTVEIKRVS